VSSSYKVKDSTLHANETALFTLFNSHDDDRISTWPVLTSFAGKGIAMTLYLVCCADFEQALVLEPGNVQAKNAIIRMRDVGLMS
jgi:hypothetical protein